jgi:DNA-binding IclR family transcriptional regulator
VIAAYMLIQAKAGQAATVAAALRDVPGVVAAASVAGPSGVIARAQAQNIGELGRLVVSGVQAPGGVRPAMSCPVVHR